MRACVVGIVVGALAACGGKEEDPSTTNPAVAASAISALGSFEAAQSSGDAATAASQMISLGAAAGSIIVPADPNPMPAAVPQSASAVTGTCTCTPTSCTFEACGAEDGSWTIDGTVSRDGDTYTADLSVSIDTAGFMWSWSYEGTVTITDTLIDGSLRGSGRGSYQDTDVDLSASWSWALDFEQITRDESGCPVGGSLHAEVDLNARGNGQSVSFYATGDVAFGPTCGEAEPL